MKNADCIPRFFPRGRNSHETAIIILTLCIPGIFCIIIRSTVDTPKTMRFPLENEELKTLVTFFPQYPKPKKSNNKLPSPLPFNLFFNSLTLRYNSLTLSLISGAKRIFKVKRTSVDKKYGYEHTIEHLIPVCTLLTGDQLPKHVRIPRNETVNVSIMSPAECKGLNPIDPLLIAREFNVPYGRNTWFIWIGFALIFPSALQTNAMKRVWNTNCVKAAVNTVARSNSASYT